MLSKLFGGLILGAGFFMWLNPAGFGANVAPSKFQDGDIIFQTSKSSQSKAVQLATHSKYSHMGLLFQDKNRWYVYEATGPVKLTPFEKWIEHGERGRYEVRRLQKSAVTASDARDLKAVCDRYRGRPYDPYFGWGDDKIYCSELVWKAYKNALSIELAKPRTLSTFDLSSPAVRAKLKERYGMKIPLQELAVSPADIFDSPLLKPVR